MCSLIRFAKSSPVVKLFFLVLMTATAPPTDAQVEERFEYCTAPSEPGRAPDYSIQRHQYTVEKPPVLYLQISIRTEASGGAAVVRLGCKLASDFPKEKAIHALIFDDKKAARNLALGFTDERHYGTYLWHLRARYELDREKKRHFIEFLFPEVQDELLSLRRFRIRLSLAD